MQCPLCQRVFPDGRSVCPFDGSALSRGAPEEEEWRGATVAKSDSPPENEKERSNPVVRATAASRAVTPAIESHSGEPAPGATPAESGSRAPARVTAVESPVDGQAASGSPAGEGVTGPSPSGSPAGEGVTGPSPSLADVALPVGTLVGEYQVTGLLGSGGMGSVYAGVQPLIGKRVAIKVLLRELATNPKVVNRFIQEARAVNQAQSRYIVDIFSFGELPDGRQYFVMEYLEGSSLRQFLRGRRALTFDEANAILLCVTRGLMAAHNKGIVHRDIKPENIVVRCDEDGALSAKLLDFGIAKLQPGEQSSPGFATKTGAAMGTPYYMSPEQCRGIGVDHRTDIYALGIIMFEMFTGALPFSARSYIDLVNKHLYAAPPPPSKLRHNISPSLESLILRCVAKDPEERPQSVEQVMQELQQLAPSLAGTLFNLEPVPSRAVEEEETPREIARHAVESAAPAYRQSGSALRTALFAALLVLATGGGVMAAILIYRGATSSDSSPPATGPSRHDAAVLSDGTASAGTVPSNDSKTVEPDGSVNPPGPDAAVHLSTKQLPRGARPVRPPRAKGTRRGRPAATGRPAGKASKGGSHLEDPDDTLDPFKRR